VDPSNLTFTTSILVVSGGSTVTILGGAATAIFGDGTGTSSVTVSPIVPNKNPAYLVTGLGSTLNLQNGADSSGLFWLNTLPPTPNPAHFGGILSSDYEALKITSGGTVNAPGNLITMDNGSTLTINKAAPLVTVSNGTLNVGTPTATPLYAGGPAGPITGDLLNIGPNPGPAALNNSVTLNQGVLTIDGTSLVTINGNVVNSTTPALFTAGNYLLQLTGGAGAHFTSDVFFFFNPASGGDVSITNGGLLKAGSMTPLTKATFDGALLNFGSAGGTGNLTAGATLISGTGANLVFNVDAISMNGTSSTLMVTGGLLSMVGGTTTFAAGAQILDPASTATFSGYVIDLSNSAKLTVTGLVALQTTNTLTVNGSGGLVRGLTGSTLAFLGPASNGQIATVGAAGVGDLSASNYLIQTTGSTITVKGSPAIDVTAGSGIVTVTNGGILKATGDGALPVPSTPDSFGGTILAANDASTPGFSNAYLFLTTSTNLTAGLGLDVKTGSLAITGPGSGLGSFTGGTVSFSTGLANVESGDLTFMNTTSSLVTSTTSQVTMGTTGGNPAIKVFGNLTGSGTLATGLLDQSGGKVVLPSALLEVDGTGNSTGWSKTLVNTSNAATLIVGTNPPGTADKPALTFLNGGLGTGGTPVPGLGNFASSTVTFNEGFAYIKKDLHASGTLITTSGIGTLTVNGGTNLVTPDPAVVVVGKLFLTGAAGVLSLQGTGTFNQGLLGVGGTTSASSTLVTVKPSATLTFPTGTVIPGMVFGAALTLSGGNLYALQSGVTVTGGILAKFQGGGTIIGGLTASQAKVNVTGGTGFDVELSLLTATAPLFALVGTTATFTNASMVNAGGGGGLSVTGPLDAIATLNGSKVTITNANLFAQGVGTSTLGGPGAPTALVSLTSGSTLTINNGALAGVTTGGVLTLYGNLARFGNVGTNLIAITNNTPLGGNILTTSIPNLLGVPVLLTGGASASQVHVDPLFVPFTGLSATNKITFTGPSAAALAVNGTGVINLHHP
jgi:hypothetical protein